jgi:mRNA interferase YafQ
MKYGVFLSSKFKKDLKKIRRQGKDVEKLNAVINLLALGEKLPPHYNDHSLTGNLTNHRECHIEPDWLLIYQIKSDVLVLHLVRTGSHSEILE